MGVTRTGRSTTDGDIDDLLRRVLALERRKIGGQLGVDRGAVVFYARGDDPADVPPVVAAIGQLLDGTAAAVFYDPVSGAELVRIGEQPDGEPDLVVYRSDGSRMALSQMAFGAANADDDERIEFGTREITVPPAPIDPPNVWVTARGPRLNGVKVTGGQLDATVGAKLECGSGTSGPGQFYMSVEIRDTATGTVVRAPDTVHALGVDWSGGGMGTNLQADRRIPVSGLPAGVYDVLCAYRLNTTSLDPLYLPPASAEGRTLRVQPY